MNFTIFGAGYVGLSMATMLARTNHVVIFDNNIDKIDKINRRMPPFVDKDISTYFQDDLFLNATYDKDKAISFSDNIIIALPTNYNQQTAQLDVSTIITYLAYIYQSNPGCNVIIKSTLPIGFTQRIQYEYPSMRIIYNPEFLREGYALYDNLYPSRILVGISEANECVNTFANNYIEVIKKAAIKKNIPSLIMNSTAAEATKLFSNAYLALRISFFNEIDSFAEFNNLQTGEIIKGICLDPRINDYYNNPSFGFGGYCLPKDVMELQGCLNMLDSGVINSIIKSNKIRKEFIANRVCELLKEKNNNKPILGIYRLIMKTGSDNFRNSSIIDILSIVKSKLPSLEIIIYEPYLTQDEFMNCTIINDISIFKTKSTIVITNRYDDNLEDVFDKIYTRDCFFRD